MSDRDNEPTDLFDVVCRLDDLAEWLDSERQYAVEAAQIRATSLQLKRYIVDQRSRLDGQG